MLCNAGCSLRSGLACFAHRQALGATPGWHAVGAQSYLPSGNVKKQEDGRTGAAGRGEGEKNTETGQPHAWRRGSCVHLLGTTQFVGTPCNCIRILTVGCGCLYVSRRQGHDLAGSLHQEVVGQSGVNASSESTARTHSASTHCFPEICWLPRACNSMGGPWPCGQLLLPGSHSDCQRTLQVTPSGQGPELPEDDCWWKK